MVSVKNNNVYVKIEGFYFIEKKEALKDLGFRWNPVNKTWYAPASLKNEALQAVHETFTKEENDEADIWYADWEKSLLTSQFTEEPIHIKDYLLY